MPDSPDSIIVKNVEINDLTGFRYGGHVLEQQFFELKFRQPLFGSPFTFGIDDPQSYNNLPFTLNFGKASGKSKTVIATIVNLEFIQSPGHQPEVIISGTMYAPSGNLSKFRLFLAAMVLAPVLFLTGLSLYVAKLDNNLIEKQGTLQTFNQHSYKRFKNISFKLSGYTATFERQYDRPLLDLTSENITDIFGAGNTDLKPDNTTSPVSFYIFKADEPRLGHADERINFFSLHPVKGLPSSLDHYYDLTIFATNKVAVYLSWYLCFLVSAGCLIGAYFCYKMYALYHHRKNVVAFWFAVSSFALISLLVINLL